MLREYLLSDDSVKLIRENKNEIFKLIPELKKCDGFEQYNDYHIYDVFEHILHVLENVGDNYLLKIAALFHDIGKPISFILDENGVGHFYGHWNKSLEIFYKYKDMFGLNEEEIDIINNLIYYHDLNINDKTRKTFFDVFDKNVDLLIVLKKADILSQNPKYYSRLDELDYINNLIK